MRLPVIPVSWAGLLLSAFRGTTTMAPDRKSLHFTGSATDGETVAIDVTC